MFHLAAFLINGCMFALTVQIFVSQDPDLLARSDYLNFRIWKDSVAAFSPDNPAPPFIVSKIIAERCGLVVLLTTISMLLSLFALMYYHYVRILGRGGLGEVVRNQALFGYLEMLVAFAAGVNTMVNVGYFLLLVAGVGDNVLPKYMVNTSELTVDSKPGSLLWLLDNTPTFNVSDPFHFAQLTNVTTDTYSLYGRFVHVWVVEASSVYIALGTIFALTATVPLIAKVLGCTVRKAQMGVENGELQIRE